MRIKKTTSIKATTQTATKPNYSEAQKHIKCAIDELGKQAKSDVLAKESIANLSVVLFDLM